MNRLTSFVKRHKILFIGLALALAAFGYYGYRRTQTASAETRYVLSQASKGLFITTVSGSGQVSSQASIGIRPKVSGTVTSVPVKVGQTVKAGDLLVTVDDLDAQKAVRDARQNVQDAKVGLQSSQLSLAKLKLSPTAADLLAAQDALNQAERDLAALNQSPNQYDLAQAQAQVTSAQLNTKISADGKTPQVVRNAYDGMVGNLRSAEQTIQSTLSDADGVLGIDSVIPNIDFKNMFSILDTVQKSNAVSQYQAVKTAYGNVKSAVDPLALQNADTAQVDQAVTVTKDAIDQAQILIQYILNGLNATLASASVSQATIDGYKSTMQGDAGTLNTRAASFVTQTQTITQAQTTYQTALITLQNAQNALAKLNAPPTADALAAAQEKVKEKRQALADAQAGPTSVDLAMAQNAIAQKQSALQAAQNKLADAVQALGDYQVRAPFAGVVAELPTQQHDQASAGTAVATIITPGKLATLSLNEVDAAKIQTGQKATLTFDAIDGLSITGDVAEVSPLGTVSQGVVSYTIKIVFDTQDARVKDGMSVNANIITSSLQDAVTVPNSAVKTDSTGQSYVQVVDNPPSDLASGGVALAQAPRQVPITVGATNDTATVVASGLVGGESVVTRTVTATNGSASNSGGFFGLRLPGVGGGGGGNANRATGGSSSSGNRSGSSGSSNRVLIGPGG